MRIGCSLILASSVEERAGLYERLGKIYGKRSSLIHGSSNEGTYKELIEIEQVSRRVLRRILRDDILPNYVNRKLQRQFLLELQLGKEVKVLGE